MQDKGKFQKEQHAVDSSFTIAAKSRDKKRSHDGKICKF